MFAFAELINRILSIIAKITSKIKRDRLQGKYDEINKDLEGYVTGDNSDGNTGVFTPNGKPPELSDLRAVKKTKS